MTYMKYIPSNTILLTAAILALVYACAPDRDDDFSLPPLNATAQMSVRFLENDSNRVVITDQTTGDFQRLWGLPGAVPKVSSKAVDTIFYTDSGQYTITLFVSFADGSGTVSTSTTINILKDAPLNCSPKLELLTGCGSATKCWKFVTAGGAVKVGPEYGDFSWYTSPENGLQDEQYNDRYCFTFNDFVFQYDNAGQTVNPWNGYAAEPYDPGISEFLFLEGTGTDGHDQIILPDDQFMGTWDSDNVLDVITLTETDLVIRARICNQAGTPTSGWFEFVFVAE